MFAGIYLLYNGQSSSEGWSSMIINDQQKSWAKMLNIGLGLADI